MAKQKLVLTGLDYLWPEKEKEAFYLGPWCFAYNKKHSFSESVNFKLIDSPYKNIRESRDWALYIDTVSERLIKSLRVFFNRWYGTSFSERFWEISLISYLTIWLGAFYYRYKYLEKSREYLTDGNVFSVKILENPYQFEISTHSDLYGELYTHEYNLCLFSILLQKGSFNFLETENIKLDIHSTFSAKKVTGKGFTEKIFDKITGMCSSDIYLGSVYGLNPFEKVKLLLARRGRRKEWQDQCRSILPVRKMSDFCGDEIEFSPENDFEQIVKSEILRHMPADMFSGIPGLEKTEKVRYWIGNDVFQDQEKHFKIARIVENGGKWISTQHGGGYGFFHSFPSGRMDYKASDGFLSWGWTHKQIYDCDITPLKSPKLSKLSRHSAKNEDILFIGTMGSLYCNRLHSVLKPEDFIHYLNNKRSFITGLPDNLISKINYRGYYSDFGTSEKSFLCGILKDDQFMSRKLKLSEALSSSRIIVIDHLQTSIMELLAINAPFIIYFEPDHYAVLNESRGDFDELEKVKIYFKSPVDAAKHLVSVYENIYEWWNDSETKSVRKKISNKYALSGNEYFKDWADFIKSLS